jgi:hypothetical protein
MGGSSWGLRGNRQSFPCEMQLLFGSGAFGKIKVNQCLIGNAGGCGRPFEVINRVNIKVNRYRLFQLLRIGVGLSVGKIIFISHNCHIIQ